MGDIQKDWPTPKPPAQRPPGGNTPWEKVVLWLAVLLIAGLILYKILGEQ